MASLFYFGAEDILCNSSLSSPSILCMTITRPLVLFKFPYSFSSSKKKLAVTAIAIYISISDSFKTSYIKIHINIGLDRAVRDDCPFFIYLIYVEDLFIASTINFGS